jgi:hypothetical protein
MNAGILATPNTVWDEDDYVVLANASECYWTGSVWAVGRAPAP